VTPEKRRRRGLGLTIALNDTPFADPQQAIELLQQIAHGAVMAATIERQGKIERLTLDGTLIASAERDTTK
jgi:type II secretory pathway component PulC